MSSKADLSESLEIMIDVVLRVRALSEGNPKLADVYKLVRNTPTLEQCQNVLTAHMNDPDADDEEPYFGCGC